MNTIWRTTLSPGSVALMSRWNLFWTISDQGSWVLRTKPTLLEISTTEYLMKVRVILWCTGLKYKRGQSKRCKWQVGVPLKVWGRNPNTGRTYTKTSTLMCEMTVPLHGTGKLLSMDSGFCVTVGILHSYEHGVYGQSIIKKKKYWPKGCPGTHITWRFL